MSKIVEPVKRKTTIKQEGLPVPPKGVRKAGRFTSVDRPARAVDQQKKKGSRASTKSRKRKPKSKPAKADRRVTCGICGSRVAFRNLSKHRSKKHPKEASKSARRGYNTRTRRAIRISPQSSQMPSTMPDHRTRAGVQALVASRRRRKGY